MVNEGYRKVLDNQFCEQNERMLIFEKICWCLRCPAWNGLRVWIYELLVEGMMFDGCASHFILRANRITLQPHEKYSESHTQ